MGVWVLLAVAATVLIGLGDAVDYGQFGLVAIACVGVGCVLAWSAATPALARITADRVSSHNVAVVALVAAVVGTVRFGGGLYGSGPYLGVSTALMIVAGMLALLLVTVGHARQAFATATVLVVGASVAMVIASPEPRIDVWGMYEAASHALLHLHNIYTAQWHPDLPGEASRFTYLPGSALLLTPFYAVFGDVRYGIIAAQVASAFLIQRIWRHPYAPVLSALLLLYPRFAYSVEQSWSEPVALAVLLTFVWLVRHGRVGWAVVAFTVLLTLQQYDLAFVPMAAVWSDFGWKRTAMSLGAATVIVTPWFIAAPHAFFAGTVSYDMQNPYAAQSLSFFNDLSHIGNWLAFGLLGLAVAGGVAVGAMVVRRHGRFALGCALVVSSVCIFDKIARFNEWQLVAALILAAAAEHLCQPTGDAAAHSGRPIRLEVLRQPGARLRNRRGISSTDMSATS